MSWYTNFLSIYGKEYNTIPPSIIEDIRNKIINLQSENPLISVVIIAYNEEKHLLSNLWSVCATTCSYPLEIIGIDNNSTDHTIRILEETGVRYFTETKKGPGHARQCGLNHAKGKYYVCMDADTVYPPDYIESMVKPMIKEPKNMGVYSLWSYPVDKKHSWPSLKLYEGLRDAYLIMQSFRRPELNVRGMVFAFRIKEAKKIGFRTDIIRGEDGSLALELKKYGKIYFLIKLNKRPITGYGTLNQDSSFIESFKKRFIKVMKNGINIFYSKKDYTDEDSNLIK